MSFWMYPDERYYYGWYEEGAAPRLTDGEIKAAIVQRLRENAFTRDHELKVDVKHGVVILRGEVGSRLAKRSAGDDCWDTPGVIDVSNQLTVDGTSTPGAVARPLRELMTPSPVAVTPATPVAAAAAMMRDADVGALVVVDEEGAARGIVTDRDLVVRVLADELRVGTVADAATPSPVTVDLDDAVDDVIRLMTSHAVRRVPVVEGGRVVGIVSLGDLARDRDPASALGEISAAPPS